MAFFFFRLLNGKVVGCLAADVKLTAAAQRHSCLGFCHTEHCWVNGVMPCARDL